jgi:hypothetical protein
MHVEIPPPRDCRAETVVPRRALGAARALLCSWSASRSIATKHMVTACAARNILTLPWEPTSPPRLMAARAPPLGEMREGSKETLI